MHDEIRRQGGMVTAETAMVLPLLIAVTALLVWVVALGVAQVRLVDAAREGARMAARGDPDDMVRVGTQKMAPGGSEVVVRPDRTSVTVQVRLHARPELPVFRRFPGIDLEATAVSAREDADR